MRHIDPSEYYSALADRAGRVKLRAVGRDGSEWRWRAASIEDNARRRSAFAAGCDLGRSMGMVEAMDRYLGPPRRTT